MKPNLSVVLVLLAAAACDKTAVDRGAPEAAATAVAATASAAPEPPRAPDIILDQANIAVGNDRVATGEPALRDKIAGLVAGRPMIAGQVVSVVAMRNAKPSQVVMTVAALRRAKASGVVIKTEARDGSTQKLSLSFTSGVPDCTTVAWIAKDAIIDVWPAGGGAVKRVSKGLAGPDMTLGLDAMRAQWSGCSSSQVVVGADDALTWGLAFDLASSALQAPGARADSAVLVSDATPGHKLTL